MIFDVSKLKVSTKSLIAFLIGLGSLLEVPQIGVPVTAFAAHHTHFAIAFGVLTGVITLLHNPAVDRILGISTTTASTTLAIGEVSKTDTTSTTVTPVTDAVMTPSIAEALKTASTMNVDANGSPLQPPANL
jgi:hypothetical protein